MKTVDEPESPTFSPDGKTVAFAALRGGVGDIYTVDLETEGQSPTSRTTSSPTTAPTLFARRQVPRLQRARQRQPEAVPPRSRHEEEDAAHLRHRTTRRRRSSSTTTRSCSRRRPPIPTVPLEPEVAQERQHLQHLDARPEDRRAAAVHRRARRQLSAGRAERRQDEHASPSSATTRASTASTRSSARSRCTRRRARTSARPAPIIDFQAPLQHTLVAEQHAQEEDRSRRCSSRAGRR